jgi:hypothetical protein
MLIILLKCADMDVRLLLILSLTGIVGQLTYTPLIAAFNVLERIA